MPRVTRRRAAGARSGGVDEVSGHGNFGEELPTVHRWPFDYSVPGADQDFIPQDVAPAVASKV